MTKHFDLLGLRRGIIISCDVTKIEVLEKIVEETKTVQGVVGYKVGCLLGLKYGLHKIKQVIFDKTNLPIIYDHQKAGTDIPAIGEKLIDTCKEAGISALIVFPFSGPATLKSFVNAALKEHITLIVGAAMTHEQFFESEGGYLSERSIESMYDYAASLGVSHFVVPATRPNLLLKYVRLISRHCRTPSFLLPGVGTQGGRISEAFDQLEGHNAYAIIGSAVYASENMKENASRFAAEAIKSDCGERET